MSDAAIAVFMAEAFETADAGVNCACAGRGDKGKAVGKTERLSAF